MSYILEALKKSEEERRRGTAPGLQTVHTVVVQQPEKRAWWPWLLLAVLVVNASLLLWWVHPWQPGKSDASRQELASRPQQSSQGGSEPVKTASVPAQPLPENAALDRTASERTSSGKKPAVAATDVGEKTPGSSASALPPRTGPESVKSASPQKPSNSPPQASAPAAPAQVSPASPRQSTATSLPVPEAPKKAARAARDSANRPGAAARSTDAAAAANVSDILRQVKRERESADSDASRRAQAKTAPSFEAVESGGSPATDRGPASTAPATGANSSDIKSASNVEQSPMPSTLPELHELPFAVQKAVPDMSFSVLIYSTKPEERMVNVNGHSVREGQEVSNGLKLEQVTPDGAVFSFQGHRFQKKVF